MNFKTRIHILKTSLIVTAVYFTISSHALEMTKPKSIDTEIEIWEGMGYQNDDSLWFISATFSKNKYTIDYPSLNCGGKLIPLSISNSEYQFQEKLSYGKSRCLDNGHITITINSHNLALFSYKHPQGTATGQLIRQ